MLSRLNPVYFFVVFLLATRTGFSQPSDFWNVDFARADSVAFRYHDYSLKKPDALTDSLVINLTTDAEKFRAIFRWITDNIRYDYKTYLKIMKMEGRRRKFRRGSQSALTRLSKKTFRRTIIKKEAVCSGYAMLLEYMCNHAGIQCNVVEGYARTYNTSAYRRPNHAWNSVYLNGKWYLADATWASGFVDPHVRRFFKKFNKNYFLTDPGLLIASHYPRDKQWTLIKDPPTLNSFNAAPLTLDGFIQNKINRYTPANGSITQKLNERIKFLFTSNADSVNSKAHLIIKGKKFRREIDIEMQRVPTGEYVIEHRFEKKGFYLVYIAINQRDTFVYRVSVK